MTRKIFNASQFTPTKWESSEQKAKFANQFVDFVRSDFSLDKFPVWFYQRLSSTFGHVPHYDRGGFVDTFFTSTARKIDFIQTCLQYPCYGDPGWTYSDVEKSLHTWLVKEKILEKLKKAL